MTTRSQPYQKCLRSGYPAGSLFILVALAAAVLMMVPATGQAATATATGSPAFIANPTWRPVDFVTFSTDLNGQSNILAPPNHQPHQDLGTGPGDAHDPPYDTELSDALATAGITDKKVFSRSEFNLELTNFTGNAVWFGFMVIADPNNAPTGLTPDGNTPVIPNSLFPLNLTATVTHNTGSDVTMVSIPALDAALNPPFAVDGHSHAPVFFGESAAFFPNTVIPGVYDISVAMMDAGGNGFTITDSYTVVPVPAAAWMGLVLLGSLGGKRMLVSKFNNGKA